MILIVINSYWNLNWKLSLLIRVNWSTRYIAQRITFTAIYSVRHQLSLSWAELQLSLMVLLSWWNELSSAQLSSAQLTAQAHHNELQAQLSSMNQFMKFIRVYYVLNYLSNRRNRLSDTSIRSLIFLNSMFKYFDSE